MFCAKLICGFLKLNIKFVIFENKIILFYENILTLIMNKQNGRHGKTLIFCITR